MFSMFALGNATCGVCSARERSLRRLAARRKLEDAYWRRSHATAAAGAVETPRRYANRMPATSAGVILPETGQFLLLCSLHFIGCAWRRHPGFLVWSLAGHGDQDGCAYVLTS